MNDSPAAATPIRVLVVDPLADLGVVLVDLCELHGWMCKYAATRSRAVEIQREFQAHVALIEHRLPDGTGWDLPALFRHSCDAVPVCIAVTGFVDEDAAAKARDRGFHRCVLKPADFGVLRLEIESALAARGAQQAIRKASGKGFRESA